MMNVRCGLVLLFQLDIQHGTGTYCATLDLNHRSITPIVHANSEFRGVLGNPQSK